MALTVDDLIAHLNATGIPADDAEMALRQRMLDGASAHIGNLLGFAVDDADQSPDGTPADLETAILMLAAYWYDNRETGFISTAAQAIEVPFSVWAIVNEHRNYSFGDTCG
jgi:hypothetical protein